MVNKMSARIKQNYCILHVLASPETHKEVYTTIVRHSNKELIKAIAEVFYNIGHLKFPLHEEAFEFLGEFPKTIQALGRLKANRADRQLLLKSHHIVKVGLQTALDFLGHETGPEDHSAHEDVLSHREHEQDGREARNTGRMGAGGGQGAS